jgi:hypothetical protein
MSGRSERTRAAERLRSIPRRHLTVGRGRGPFTTSRGRPPRANIRSGTKRYGQPACERQAVIDRHWFHSIYFREPGGVVFEIADDEPGIVFEQDVADLGTRLLLPPWLEPRRDQIERGLEPLPNPRAGEPWAAARDREDVPRSRWVLTPGSRPTSRCG